MNRGLAAAGLVALVTAVVIAVAAGVRSNADDGASPPPPETVEKPAPKTTPAPPKNVAVRLRGLRGYDPEGDGRERDETAPLATDRNASTSWETENYTSFFKDGVGLLLDAGTPTTLTRVVLTTDTPGVKAGIRVGGKPDGPFTAVTKVKALGRTTTFVPRARKGRYVVVWIDDIPGGGSAHVSEVRAWKANGA